jgi:hypothetical protein
MIGATNSSGHAGPRFGAGVVLSLTLAVAGCHSNGSENVCTALYATIGVSVIDSAGLAVGSLSGITVQDSILRTGQVITIAQLGFPTTSATIFTDGNIASVLPAGDSVVVVGTLGSRSFRSGYRFGSDGCHVSRIAGPDVVVLR